MKALSLLTLPPLIACCALAQERLEQPARARLQCTTADKTIIPLAGVVVKVDNLVMSDQNGKIKLSITPNKEKTYSFAQIKKAGYTLIHPRPEDIAAHKAFAHNPNAELDIILRDDAELEAEQDRYIKQGKSYYRERQKQLKDEMEAEQNPARKRQLGQELDTLIGRRDQIMGEIETRARELARTDYLVLGEDEIRRIELRKAGKLDELIELINSKLAQDHEAYAKEIELKLQEAKERKKLARQDQAELMVNLKEEVKLLREKADAMTLQRKYQEAAASLKDCLLYLPDDYQCHREYAKHIQQYLAAYVEALEVYQTCAQLAKRQFGDGSAELAASHNDMGMAYYDQGLYAEALECCIKALAIREKLLGKKHLDTAQSYNDIGLVYQAQGKNAKALEYLSKALSIRERVQGKDHPLTAESYNNMGALYCTQRKYSKALAFHLKALAIREKVLGSNHLHTAQSYSNMGLLYSEQGDKQQAILYLDQALNILQQILGKDHPTTIQTQTTRDLIAGHSAN